ncbi:MAG: exodeoxyribonuclease VII small subunit [Bacteroidota bacterium]
MKKEETYDSAMAELTAIIRELEDETISVDKLSVKVKRAKELIRFCKEKLLKTEKEVEGLLDAAASSLRSSQ